MKLRRTRNGFLVLALCVFVLMTATGCPKKPMEPPVSPEPAPAPVVEPEPVQVEPYTPPVAPEPEPEPEPVTPPPVVKPAFVPQDVFFAFDDFSLTTEARDALVGNAEGLKENPGMRISIEGHCDERGTREYNLGLGERRAASAKDYLVSLGVSAGRIDTISYGEERPFEKGHNETAWSQNRRAHIVIISR